MFQVRGLRRFLRVFVSSIVLVVLVVTVVSRGEAQQATSNASSIAFDNSRPSAPTVLITPPTGTGFGTAARNTMFLCSNFAGFNTTGITLTTPNTSWVDGQKLILSKIPYIVGEVDWNKVPNARPKFRTSVQYGMRRFKGNGIPNHPTGIFPMPANQPAYQYYAAVPDPSGEYENAAEMPMAPYDLDISVPANPVYSKTPSCFNDLTIGVVTQTGATLHANIALASGPNPYVDPVAALPMDKCWGHPYDKQYHYHGYSWKCFPNQGKAKEHSPLFGYALDGFGVYGPRGDGGKLMSNKDLDECHGHFGLINWNGQGKYMYHYHVNNEYPYGPGCYRGTPATVPTNMKHSHFKAAPATDSEGEVHHRA